MTKKRKHTPWLTAKISCPSLGSSIWSPAVKWKAAGSRIAITDTISRDELSCTAPVHPESVGDIGSDTLWEERTGAEALFRKPSTSCEKAHSEHKDYKYNESVSTVP